MKKASDTKNYTPHPELPKLRKALDEYGVTCSYLTRSYAWCQERDEVYYGLQVCPKGNDDVAVKVHLYDSKKYEFSRGRQYSRDLVIKSGFYAEERRMRNAGQAWEPEWTVLVEYEDLGPTEQGGIEVKELSRKYELTTKNLAHKIFGLLGSSIKADNFRSQLKEERKARRARLDKLSQDLGFKDLDDLEDSPFRLSEPKEGVYEFDISRLYDMPTMTAEDVRDALAPLVTWWRKRSAEEAQKEKEKENDNG